ncbi:hypothetical protein T492DRAFT_480861 [Pavlovales sp. CCMP2436]|nr:hypothetical protein T492DRAFT_480861 [Pavlovales sp. CCMP2436]
MCSSMPSSTCAAATSSKLCDPESNLTRHESPSPLVWFSMSTSGTIASCDSSLSRKSSARESTILSANSQYSQLSLPTEVHAPSPPSAARAAAGPSTVFHARVAMARCCPCSARTAGSPSPRASALHSAPPSAQPSEPSVALGQRASHGSNCEGARASSSATSTASFTCGPCRASAASRSSASSSSRNRGLTSERQAESGTRKSTSPGASAARAKRPSPPSPPVAEGRSAVSASTVAPRCCAAQAASPPSSAVPGLL